MTVRQKQRDVEAGLRDQTNLLPKRELIILFSTLAASLLVCFIDQNGIGVLLPSIAKDIDAENTISWAGTSNLIANTVFQVLYGRLSDLFGRKLVYVSALALLCISDLLCGFAVNSTMLYVFRGLAGVAGGGITSLSMMIVSDVVTLEDRGKYQGILGAMVGTGNLVGPLIGAAFAQHATWRALFWFIAPVAAICCIVNWFMVPATVPTKDFKGNVRKIDFYGLFTGSLATILILIPISGGGSYFEWDSPMVIAMLTVGGVLGLAFIFVEWKVAPLPMMPLSLFKNIPVAVLIIQNFFYGVTYYAYLYYLPIYYQNVRNFSPLISACLTIPIVFFQSFSSIISGLYISHYKRYGEVIWAGFIIWTIGASLTTLFSRTLHIAAIVIISCLNGIGVGFVFQPTLVAMQAHATKAQRAVVISNRNFLRSLGGAFGLAISAAVLQNTLKKNMPAAYADLARSTYSTPDYSRYNAADSDAIHDAYAKASRAVFITLAPFIALCLFGCFFVKDRGLTRPDEMDQQTPAESQVQSQHVMSQDCDKEDEKDCASFMAVPAPVEDEIEEKEKEKDDDEGVEEKKKEDGTNVEEKKVKV
ncbi:putative mfs protein [Lasiodiplodia theobromae]|uniref:Putative transporter n=1 Tax=Lasiodiplodia theobromae TaxID=45133 RepID=A0A5N5DNZ6_9PEZI|nr:MFS transporter [Lasiodiplodia theobromae]KAB2579523.1 putative transporter [Lasiodiplodia theobromae]KAF4542206.1 MFS transporter [Lasiodiplodia theobromae]KAF9635362.1 putative mfs protein [Lasiodiplodia theobromae]